MRKKRVLALLLAFSMAVSTNGMTVFATETGTEPASAVMEAEPEETESADEIEETTPESEDAAGENGAEDPEKSGDDAAETEDSETETEAPEEDGAENGDAQSEPDTSISEEIQEDAISDNTVEETKEEIVEEGHEIRLMSFTDETGMRVTYDANAAATYTYTVENGVLKAVTDENGKQLSGVVELAADQNITAIGEAFAGNTAITYVKLPAGVTSINDGAFKGCSSLKGIYLPNTMGTIGASAFESCTKMTQLAIPKNVKSIGARAFVGDTALFMVYMRDADYSSLISIGDEAFKGCTALSKFCSDDAFVIPGNLETIGASAFEGCTSIDAVNLNESVTTLGEAAFRNCGSITSVITSSKLTDIPDEAFKGCNNLISLTFKSGNASIGASAFEGCTGLGGIKLLYSIKQVGNYAFRDCSKLLRAEIASGEIVLGDAVFSGCAADLTLIGQRDSNVETYAKNNDIKFVYYLSEEEEEVHYYKYDVFVPGQTPGGKIIVKDAAGKDPNTLNPDSSKKGQGVTAGTKLFVTFQPDQGYKMVTGSLKYNGKVINADKNGVYSFAMPMGGALITAEFESINAGKTLGIDSDISVELSNGATVNSKNEVDGAALKVGQSTRMFLIDGKDGNRAVKTSKITFTSGKTSVATIDAGGVIRAVKAGKAEITASVIGYDDKKIVRSIIVDVTSADVDEIRLKAVDYDAAIVKLTQSSSGSNMAVIDKTETKNKANTFSIKATAYDTEGDDTSVVMKWTSSDTKVAKLETASTTTTKTTNRVTIPQGATGETTITVTATNTSATAAKKTVTQKFVISVVDYTPRLADSSLTLNPNIEKGVALEIISSYGKEIDTDSIKFLKAEDGYVSSAFDVKYSEEDSNDVVKTFWVMPKLVNDGATYSLLVSVNGGTYKIPLKITIKKSEPKVKLTLDKKQPKINLFYANDGTEIKPVITGLGTAKIASYALEPLGTDEDAKLFTENFEIDSDTGVITQKSESMLYGTKNQKGKPVVSGYLVLSYQGYKSDIKTKLKITIPTQTVKPSYKLDKTAETYNNACGAQTIKLHLLDTKKKNEPVDLNDGTFDVKVWNGTDARINECTITTDGAVEMTTSRNMESGKVVLHVTNTSWASGQYFDYTYKINATSNTPKASLTAATVTMNPSYPEQVQTFALKSNQKDTVFADTQMFNAKSTVRNAEEYAKLSVTYENGEGKVEIIDPTVKNGTYTFVCDKVKRVNTRGDEVAINGVTLKVKVAKGVPTVALKGAAAFNLAATDESDNYVETAVLEMTSKNLAEGYELDVDKTKDTIQCTTKNYTDSASAFEWNLKDAGYTKNVWTGSLDVKLIRELPKKSYAFTMEPVYENQDTGNVVRGKEVKFTVKVYSASISVELTAKGKLNLVNRNYTEYTANNSIIYTPSFKNLKDKVVEVKIFDAGGIQPKYDDEESEFFQAEVLEDGKIYVSPIPGAEIDNNKTYSVKIWMKLRDYKFDSEDGYGTWSNKVQKIKTAQILPKIKTDKSTVNLYLSNKNYETSFVISKSDVKAIGSIASVDFGKEDTKTYDSKAAESLEIRTVEQADGSMKVYLKPKDAVSYSCGSTNKVNMYVRFAGQGANTDGVKLTMNVRINK